MKPFLYSIAVFLGLSAQSYAQQAPRIGCKDPYILTQATDLKHNFEEQGFEVLNDAMLSMESREDFPVMVRLKQGDFYQVIFVGNTRSSRMILDLFGPNKKPVLNKEQKPMSQTSNVISFSFTPERSEDYMFLLRQIIKKGNSCGSFTILRLKPEGER